MFVLHGCELSRIEKKKTLSYDISTDLLKNREKILSSFFLPMFVFTFMLTIFYLFFIYLFFLSKAGKTRTKDKYRVVYTDQQRVELEKEFLYNKYITIRRKTEMATSLGLSERQVSRTSNFICERGTENFQVVHPLPLQLLKISYIFSKNLWKRDSWYIWETWWSS